MHRTCIEFYFKFCNGNFHAEIFDRRDCGEVKGPLEPLVIPKRDQQYSFEREILSVNGHQSNYTLFLF